MEKGKGLLYIFVKYSAIVSTVFLFSILKPHRLYKKFISFLFKKTFKFKGADWEIYHILFLKIIFFIFLFSFIQMQMSFFKRKPGASLEAQLSMLDKKWVLETMSWMNFLIIIDLLSIYRNFLLFTEEGRIKKEIDDIDKIIKEIEDKKPLEEK